MKFRVAKPLEEASFDLTPMIDVVLLLIIFFMLTTHFAKSQRSNLDLPREKGEPVRKEPERDEIVIDMDHAGAMKILNESVTLERLPELLSSQRGGIAKARLIVRAERNCPAGHLNQLVGVLIALGVRDWRLATAGPEAVGGHTEGGG
jgi:biopolymer transport protein ExbD